MLDEKKIQAALLRFQNVDVTKIAEKVGISRATFYNWEKLEEFKAELDRLRQEKLTEADHLLANETIKSIQTMAYLRDYSSSDKVRLDAASKILDKTKSNATRIDINDGRPDSDIVTTDILDAEMEEFDNE